MVVDYQNHPEYKYSKYNFDVAILVLDKPLSFTEYVRTLCLPASPFPSSLEDEKAMVVAGWGKDENGGYN